VCVLWFFVLCGLFSFRSFLASLGFSFVLSEEDTGTGTRNHLNSTATEWWVAFYKPNRLAIADDLPQGFLAEDRTDHADYERVPYAFPFRTNGVDLVFISVHLKPGDLSSDTARRAHELNAIASWIAIRDSSERDYVILGDMNIENCGELADVLPEGYASLNNECLPTNTNIRNPRPYDHVMYSTEYSSNEIDTEAGFVVINLIEAMRDRWTADAGPYPGDPYRHNAFRTKYSDHHPVSFQIRSGREDDD